jgi:hypothetical protein
LNGDAVAIGGNGVRGKVKTPRGPLHRTAASPDRSSLLLVATNATENAVVGGAHALPDFRTPAATRSHPAAHPPP